MTVRVVYAGWMQRLWFVVVSLGVALGCKVVEGPEPQDLGAAEVPALEVDPGPPDAWLADVYKPVQDQACELEPDGLAAMYPEPKYLAAISYKPKKAKFLPQIATYAQLTEEHEKALASNGFVAVGNSRVETFATSYLDIYTKHLPVLITADSLLYALHQSYDSMLLDFEVQVLIPASERLLAAMHQQLTKDLAGLPAGLRPASLDLDVYLAVARSLLGGSKVAVVSGDAAAQAKVTEILAAAAALQPAELSLFGVTGTHDMSQMRPRGHYADDPTLQQYFRAMMWLGRTELAMVTFDRARKSTFNRRGLEAALLANLLLKASGAEVDWTQIDEVLGLLVGEHDSMTPSEMGKFMDDAGIHSAAELAKASDEQLFGALMRKAYGSQRIMSQVISSDPTDPQVALARVYLLMGQRFTLDSHILNNVTYDRIQDLRTGKKATRMLPSELDVQFVLGNNAAARYLRPEIDQYGYQGVLHEMRFLVDAHPPSFWDANLYHGWLAAIRALNDRSDFERWPEAMRTAAWADKGLNTQAAAWAELRHDTLLYVKQSYSMSVSCEYPDAYVEPVPKFYARLAKLGKLGTATLKELGASAMSMPMAGQFFAELSASASMLEGIARKELAGTKLGKAESDFLKAAIEMEMVGCGQVQYDGWYGRLFYNPQKIAEFTPTIADVHTAPTDEAGNPTGSVLHVATGRPMLMVFTLEDCSGVKAYVGPVSSYYSVVTEKFQRKTDEEWAQMLEQGQMKRPAWTASFVRDAGPARRQSIRPGR